MPDDHDDDDTKYGKILRDIYRSLGRVENAVSDIKETAKDTNVERDKKFNEHSNKLDALADRQQIDSTHVLNNQEKIVGQMDSIGAKVSAVTKVLDSQEDRLIEIEKPMKKALFAREARQKDFRKIWAKFILVSTAISTAIGLLIEPIWREFVATWFRQHLGG